jgi:hypothetical protein
MCVRDTKSTCKEPWVERPSYYIGGKKWILRVLLALEMGWVQVWIQEPRGK